MFPPVLGLLQQRGHLGLKVGKPDQESDSREKHFHPLAGCRPHQQPRVGPGEGG